MEHNKNKIKTKTESLKVIRLLNQFIFLVGVLIHSQRKQGSYESKKSHIKGYVTRLPPVVE